MNRDKAGRGKRTRETREGGREGREEGNQRRRTKEENVMRAALSSIPIDRHPTRQRRRQPNPSIRLPLQPLHRPLIPPNHRLQPLITHPIMFLHPLLLFLREHGVLDHLGLDGDTGETLKTEPDVTVELAFGLYFGDCEGGFEADSEFTFGVCGCVGGKDGLSVYAYVRK